MRSRKRPCIEHDSQRQAVEQETHGHQQALVLHDGTAAAEESNDENKDASGDAEDSGTEKVQRWRQRRGGVL